MRLDRFDRHLLNLAQENSERTAYQMAESVPLSVSAVQRRLRRLRQIGVIQRHCAVVDPHMVGDPAFFVVGLQVERERPELLTALRRWIAEEPQIQQAFYVTGESDFVLIVTAANTDRYDALMARMMQENPNVRRFTTNVAMNLVKRGLTIPINEDYGVPAISLGHAHNAVGIGPRRKSVRFRPLGQYERWILQQVRRPTRPASRQVPAV